MNTTSNLGARLAFIAALAAGAAAPLAAQASPDGHHPKSSASHCQNCGTVVSTNTYKRAAESGSGVGGAGGAVVGGLLGNQVGSGHGRQLATVAGAVGGAVAGNQIEGNMKTTHSWDIVVRMDNGNKRTLHASNQPQWRAGDPVRIVKGQLRSID